MPASEGDPPRVRGHPAGGSLPREYPREIKKCAIPLYPSGQSGTAGTSCPDVTGANLKASSDWHAARTIAFHPEQGWKPCPAVCFAQLNSRRILAIATLAVGGVALVVLPLAARRRS